MKIAVIGTGYVGLVTGTCLADYGHTVMCVDKVQQKVDALRRGELHIFEPGLKEIIDRNVANQRLTFTTDTAKAVAESQVIFIAVGTPPGRDGDADLSAVREVVVAIGGAMRGYRVIVNKSTVPVGTADLVAGILAENSPYPFDVVSNPEFLREGAAVEDCMHPDRIVVGVRNEHAANIMKEIYRAFEAPIVVTDPRSAEMIKYASNAFLAVKISFINEIAGMCERLGADVSEVAHGMGLDPRIGAAFLKAGIGYGGSCFPKDTQALVHMAHRAQYDLPVVDAAIKVNYQQRIFLIERVHKALGTPEGKVVGVLGLAFKPNTDDIREAPALDLLRALTSRGCTVRIYDPKAMANVKREWLSGEHPLVDPARVVPCDAPEDVAEGADALVLTTEWPVFGTLSWEAMLGRMKQPYLFDGRNFLSPVEMRNLGYRYSGVGRGVPDVTFDGAADVNEQVAATNADD